MNRKIGFALLAIGLIACLGLAASNCINLYTTEWNGEVVSDADVWVDSIQNFVGTTDENGYLLIQLDNISFKDTALTNDNIWNVTADSGNRWGTNWTTVLPVPGKCENLTIKMSR